MFSQVTKTSAIVKHTIHYDTIFDFDTETLFWALFLQVDYIINKVWQIISIAKKQTQTK
jgi:hypothetical protein